jgi:beta-mannosidase
MAEGELILQRPDLWWPHTHGEPALYRLRLSITLSDRDEPLELDLGSVGFRAIDSGDPAGPGGLRLSLNGAEVFARGAVWTPDLLHPSPERAALREVLLGVRDCGMNMLRIPGTAAYESEDFYDLCDELGIMVWQDLPFANLDYPESDPDFMAEVEAEVGEALLRLQGRPSPTVLCGSSEIAQQVAMLGLDPGLAHGPLFGELIPSLVSRHLPDLSYLPSSPWGGERPFRTDAGVAHYFGVGGYRRALCDVRRSAVRFASECLAIANVPDEEALAEMGAGAAPALGSAAWKQGVPRDAGSPWDFEDVRDHYLALLYRVDPARLRAEDPERYLELSRATSGELMAEVFSEWRRPGSPCAGGLVLWLADLRPGTGWGLMDHRRRPKPALHLLRPLLAPVAVFMTDEGLNGIAVHLVNDSSEVVRAQLRIGLYRDRQTLVGGIERELELAPRSASSHDLEALIGGFLDAGWAYRFGPPAQDLIVVTLERPGGEGSPIAQAFHHVRGRPAGTESAGALGLSATLRRDSEGGAVAILRAERYVHNVRVQVGGTVADRAWFGLEPGRPREVRLGGTPLVNHAPALEPLRGRVIATNLIGALSLVEEV